MYWNKVSHMNMHCDVVELDENIIFGSQMHGESHMFTVYNSILTENKILYIVRLFEEN